MIATPTKDLSAINLAGRDALIAKDYATAEKHFRELCSATDAPNAYINLGIAVAKQQRHDEALDILERVHHADARLVESAIHEERGDRKMMEACIEAGIEIDPQHALLRFSRGQNLLAAGKWKEGWADYEYRSTRLELLDKMDEYPEWDGKPLAKGKLLIIGEQGAGDQIMFARYIEHATRRLDNTANPLPLFYTRPELARLLQNLPCRIVTDGREFNAVDVGAWIGIGSLPHVLGILEPLSALPALSPASQPPVRLSETNNLRVGIAWAGNPQHKKDEFRSMRLEDMAPLFDVPGVDFYAFQGGVASKQNDGRAVDLLRYCHDFADSAVMLKQMDIVITVDTALLHLAGSLGVPVAALYGKPRDWRWVVAQRDWYASVSDFSCFDEKPKQFRNSIAGLCDHLNFIVSKRDDESPRNYTVESDVTAVAETMHGPMRYFQQDPWIGRSLKHYGQWSRGEQEVFDAFIRPGDVVVDAGANIGTHTVALSKLTKLNGCVHAFEPSVQTFAILQENVVRNTAGVKLYNFALGERERVAALHRDTLHPAGASLNGEGTETVGVITLDSLELKRLDFWKLDIEGAEREALQGGEKTIAKFRPLLYVENDKPDKEQALIEWLVRHDYKLYAHAPMLFRADNHNGYKVNIFGNIVSGMLFCVPFERYIDMALIEKLGLERVRFARG